MGLGNDKWLGNDKFENMMKKKKKEPKVFCDKENYSKWLLVEVRKQVYRRIAQRIASI